MRSIYSYLVIFLFLLSGTFANSQYDRDILSVRGGMNDKLVLDFSDGSGEFFKDSIIARGYRIHEGSKTMSDKSGNLQFVATTCRIWDKNFEIMPGGENYNSVGPLFQEGWCDQNSDLTLPNVFSIPVPHKDSLYYLIYFKYRWAPELASSKTDSLFYRTIDMTKRNGMGVVNNDETLLFVDTSFNAVTSAFTRHNNGYDWWFVANTIEQKYHVYYIDSLGISLIDTTIIGPPARKYLLGSGQSVFSTGGHLLSYVYEEDGLRLMDFNNSTGEISNFRYDTTVALTETSFRRGIAFSGNDGFLYVNVGGFILYQYDLDNNDLKRKEVIWEYDDSRDRTPDGFQLYLNYLQLGPDCKIYGAQPNGLPYFHIVHNPNGKGEESRFELGYHTPAYAAAATITHPHWRTATPYEDWCDTVMYTTSARQPHSMFKDHWLVYPIPARDKITITYTQALVKANHLRLYDQQGRLIKQHNGVHSPIVSMDISMIPAGLYFLHIYPEGYLENDHLRPVVKKVVKME